jgi:hypothetical protein
MDTVKCYRFHPVTGADANDFNDVPMSESQKIQVAEMVRSGAKFYWHQHESNQHWTRTERANYAFVLQVAGQSVEWIETATPQG